MHPSNDAVVAAEKQNIQQQTLIGRYISWVNDEVRRSTLSGAWHDFAAGFSREEPAAPRTLVQSDALPAPASSKGESAEDVGVSLTVSVQKQPRQAAATAATGQRQQTKEEAFGGNPSAATQASSARSPGTLGRTRPSTSSASSSSLQPTGAAHSLTMVSQVCLRLLPQGARAFWQRKAALTQFVAVPMQQPASRFRRHCRSQRTTSFRSPRLAM